MKWTTFEGKVVDTKTTTRQHLSNLIWHMLIVRNGAQHNSIDNSLLKEIVDDYKQRYGKLLLYVPPFRFKAEHEWLEGRGFVEDGKILYGNRVIGYIPKNTSEDLDYLPVLPEFTEQLEYGIS